VRPRVDFESVRIEDQARLIRERLTAAPRLRLFELISRAGGRMELIVTFMATLELVRLGEIGARQPNAFDDVYLYRKGPNRER